jgi:hypothetical protein
LRCANSGHWRARYAHGVAVAGITNELLGIAPAPQLEEQSDGAVEQRLKHVLAVVVV